MSHGPIFELLYTAHRRKLTALIEVDETRLWLERGELVHAQGVPWRSFRHAASIPLDKLLQTIEQRGADLDFARASAISDIGLHCARHAHRSGVMELGHSVSPSPWRVKAPVLSMLSRGLRELRAPRDVMAALAPDLHQPLRLQVPSLAHLRGLDPLSRTLIVQSRLLSTPALLLGLLSAGRPGVARLLLPRLDLLLHLGLLRLDCTSSMGFGMAAYDPEEDDTHQAAQVQPLDSELRALRERAIDQGPFVLLDLRDVDLDAPVRRRDLQRALERSISRFSTGPWAHTAAYQELRQLLEDARPTLRDPDTLAIWVRELRALTRIDAPVLARDRRQAPLHLDMALALRREGQWGAALAQVTRSLELDPSREVVRVDQVLCLVALKRIGLHDALLNLAALDLPEPSDQARARRTARHLTSAAARTRNATQIAGQRVSARLSRHPSAP